MEQRIRNIEDNYIKMQKTQEQILKEILELKEQTITKKELDLSNELLCNRLFVESDKKYATKATERIVYFVVGAVGLYITSSLLNLI